MSTSSVSRCFFDSSSVAPIASGSIDSYGMTTRVVSLIGPPGSVDGCTREVRRFGDRLQSDACSTVTPWTCSPSSTASRGSPTSCIHLRRHRRSRRRREVDARRGDRRAQVVSTDEFWDGEGFELPRLRAEVFEPLLAGRDARYAAWDWTPGVRAARVTSIRTGMVVVEGVCALHRMFRDEYDVRVWVEAPPSPSGPRRRARRRRGSGDVGREVDADGGSLRRVGRPGLVR